MKSLLPLAAVLFCIGTLGCTTTPTTIPVLQPAELDLSGLHRIAVPEFEGEARCALQARSELSTALAAQGRDVPPPHVVREMLPASVPYRGQGVDVRRIVEQARHAGFDAVLIGAVNWDSNADSQLIIGNPWIETKVETQLIDVRRGNVRGETTAQRKWRGELARHENADNSQRNITNQLVRNCINETASKLATKTVNIEVTFADPHEGDDQEAMQAGRKAAEQGQWDLAAEHFERARAGNPTSHAAMHNLALACEAQYHFAAARHWHTEALRLHEAENYRAALSRVDASWRDYDLAMRQTHPPRAARLAERNTHPSYVDARWQR